MPKTTIIYTCPYVPAEWIAAHGLRPYRVIPEPAEPAFLRARTEGVCPFARSFISEAMKYKQACAVVVTTLCDQMRRIFDILVRNCDLPAFLMNVPNTWQTEAAQKLYIEELKRLSRFLIHLGGVSPNTDILIKVMLEYDKARSSILAARERLTARQYAEAIADLGHNGPGDVLNNAAHSEPPAKGVPLAILGGPLMRQEMVILEILEEFGGRVVLNATETAERGMCAPFKGRLLFDDPLMELAAAYFGGIQDASRRPNSELYKWLKRQLATREIQGIIFHRYLWCDMWHAELGRLKDWTDLPVLDIDSAGNNESDRHRTENRIHAFLETLQ